MFQSESFIGKPERVPHEVYWQAVEAEQKLRLQEVKEARAYQEGLSKLSSGYLKGFHNLIGKPTLGRYLGLHRKRMLRIREAHEKFRPTAEGYAELEETKRDVLERSRKVIEKSDVNLDKVRALRQKHRESTAQLFTKTIGKGLAASSREKSPNTDFLPPYSGWSWSYSWSRSDEPNDPSLERYLDHDTGEIGSASTIRVTGADDSDYCSVLYRTAIRQWYLVPEFTARLRVRINAIDWIANSYSGRTEDECGASDIDLEQRMRFFARVTSPIVTDRVYFDWIGGGSSGFRHTELPRTINDSWDYTHVPDVPTEFAEIGGPFDEDQWVLVEVGIETYNHFWSNDVTVRMEMDQRYLLQNIGITQV